MGSSTRLSACHQTAITNPPIKRGANGKSPQYSMGHTSSRTGSKESGDDGELGTDYW